MAKFKKGDEVRINPLATREDFVKNACPESFMERLNETFEIRDVGKNSGDIVYYIRGWWVREVCLTTIKESNEL